VVLVRCGRVGCGRRAPREEVAAPACASLKDPAQRAWKAHGVWDVGLDRVVMILPQVHLRNDFLLSFNVLYKTERPCDGSSRAALGRGISAAPSSRSTLLSQGTD